ncbi:MAG: SLBB domain-containing protein [Chloroflexota bacterium]
MSTPETRPLPLLERFRLPLLLIVAVATLVGVAVLLHNRPKPVTITVLPPEPTAIPSATPIPTATPTPGPYTVYVTGAVASPQAVITLSFGSRVLHALEAAGGPLASADLERVNLAGRLNDGDQVHVPTREAGSAQTPAVTVIVVTPTPGTYTVYVVGEVMQPQSMVALPVGSRVEDAIRAAGGTTDKADLSQVNLSQVLSDGDYVYVPPLAGDTFATPTPNRPPLVHINHATLEELDALPGIGPALAQAIIDYRTEHGPFTSLQDLDNVPGLGPGKLDALRDQVIFD